jgi:hypothetical protein
LAKVSSKAVIAGTVAAEAGATIAAAANTSIESL